MKKILNKKTLIIGSMVGIIVLPTVISASVIVSTKMSNKYFVFDNKAFKEKNDLENYIKQNHEKDTIQYDSTRYNLDGKTYLNEWTLNQQLYNDNRITPILTNKMPSRYISSSTGELSDKVLPNANDIGIEVFEGSNGLAYRNKQQALDSYKISNVDKQYVAPNFDYSENTVPTMTFKTKYEIERYYLDHYLQNLQKTNVYNMGGIYKSQKEAVDYTTTYMEEGYEYQNQYAFKKNDKAEFDKFYERIKNEEPKLVDEHIVFDKDASKNYYWLDQFNGNAEGFFHGPRYVETTSDLAHSELKFRTIEENTVNIITHTKGRVIIESNITLTLAIALYKIFVAEIQHMRPGVDLNNWFSEKGQGLFTFIEDVKTIKKLDFLESTNSTLNKIMELAESSSNQTWNILYKQASSVVYPMGERLSDVEKMLIVMKNLLEYLKIYPNFGSHISIGFDKLEAAFIDVTKTIMMESGYGLTPIAFNYKEKDDFLKDYTFNDLYNLNLNSTKFFNDNAECKAKMDRIVGINKVIQDVVEVGGFVSDLGGNIVSLKENMAKSKTKTGAEKQAIIDKTTNDISTQLFENRYDIYDALDIPVVETKEQKIVIASIFTAIAIGYTIFNALNIVTYVTQELKIDENQSLYYITPTYKVPIISVAITTPKPYVEVTELKKSAASIMSNDKEVTGLYTFNGTYYLKKEEAIVDLKRDAYKNPNKYLNVDKILISPYDNSKTKKVIEGDIKQQKDKFAKEILEENGTEQSAYLDEFGGMHATETIAQDAIAEKVAQAAKEDENNTNTGVPRFQTQYTFNDGLGNIVVKPTQLEINKFIDNYLIVRSKVVSAHDTIVSSRYNDLQEYSSEMFEIFELNFKGTKKYFSSELDAKEYLLNNSSYTETNYSGVLETYEYKGYKFNSELEFRMWIEENTIIANKFQIKEKEIISYE